jgi:phosphomannomutase
LSEPIITVSGLRGVMGESLTPAVAVRYASAFVESAPPGPIVITRDGRESGPLLARAIQDGLHAAGRDTIDAGVAATPTTGVLVRQFAAAGGIQITASHNPREYNGIKLFSQEGRVLPAAAGQAVLDRYRAIAAPAFAAGASPAADSPVDSLAESVPRRRLGKSLPCSDTTLRHASLVLAAVDASRIRKRRFRLLLDSNHGAGSVLGRRLLEELGCEVTVLGGQPDGQFEHPPEPTAENLAGVLSTVRDCRADVGFCQDPDADRLAVVDESGRYLGEESTLAMCVDHVLRGRPGPIVTNCSTSRVSEDLAARYGVPFFRSAVGEANVVEVMQTQNAVLGGEGNGGVIDPRVVLVRDSFTGMALVLDAMAARQMPVSRLADELPRYAIVKTKISLAGAKVAAALAALEAHFADAKADRLDGLRLDWPGKWLLVRASNTEPIVRAIAEAQTAEEAQRLCDEAARVLALV